ncbi:hypothetical protein [uncultured Duodenibacillus sp.]|uniref:hypothetical protein n=1 Tax=uncultured Duodenibacillus sp. TaxID=1980699 RepID=UPI0025834A27|nr:hypothetical protein [uncultured Duodenibacillus sp.]
MSETEASAERKRDFSAGAGSGKVFFCGGRFPVKRLMTVRKGRPGLFPERLFFLSRCRKLCTKFEKGLKIGHSRFRPVVSGGIGNIKGEEKMQRRMFAQCLAVP